MSNEIKEEIIKAFKEDNCIYELPERDGITRIWYSKEKELYNYGFMENEKDFYFTNGTIVTNDELLSFLFQQTPFGTEGKEETIHWQNILNKAT